MAGSESRQSPMGTTHLLCMLLLAMVALCSIPQPQQQQHGQQQHQRYSKEALLQHRTAAGKTRLPLQQYRHVKDLGICTAKSTRRGRRSWPKQQKPIPVIITSHRNTNGRKTTIPRPPAVQQIKLVKPAPNVTPTTIGLWNAHLHSQ